MPDSKVKGFAKNHKAVVWGGLGLAAVVAIYLWRSKLSASTAGTSGQSTDPAGNVGTIDPSTGYVEGSPQDQAALASSSGMYDSGGYVGDPYGGGTFGSGGFTSTGGATGKSSTPSNNLSWLKKALDNLPHSSEARAAILDVLGGIPVTQEQRDIFLEAVGLLGPPPGGYPKIHTKNTAGHPKVGTSQHHSNPSPANVHKGNLTSNNRDGQPAGY